MKDQPTNKKVVIVQRTTPQYRVRFFELLRDELSARKIDLELIYGEQNEDKKNDFVPIPWANYKKMRTFKLGPVSMIWHPILDGIRNADMIIVNQHNTQLVNYVLLAERMFSRKRKIAFWDHGRNMQSKHNSIQNKVKKIYRNHCDWWFAYTPGVKKFLVENGYPERKITVVENAIDTKENLRQYQTFSEPEILALKEKYGIGPNDVVGIFCGALYKEKRIEFLLSAADAVRKDNPNFKLIVVGDGPDRDIIKQALPERSWLKWAGSQFDRNKSMHFKIADFFLLPGLVGLAVLDSFTYERPIITTEYEFHSPEFEYLDHDSDAIVCKNTIEAYVKAVNELINNKEKLDFLKMNCREKAKNITIEKMVKNFSEGISAALL